MSHSRISRDDIVAADRRHVWHPYTDMDRYELVDPLVVVRAEGARLWDADGRTYLDGNSSWWTQALGHGHPRLVAALREQSGELAHVALGGIAHEQAALLARDLSHVAPAGLSRVFYTDNGSGSVEAAAKMALQFWQNRGREDKTRFVALDGAFHGETLGATSLGGIELFRKPFASVLFDCVHVPVPGEGGYDAAFQALRTLLERAHSSIAAVFVEPIVQGALGMRMYEPAYLAELSALTSRYEVLLVADEVFTGYGRTGPMWACEHAGVSPDLLCLGKAFAGMVPMGAVLVSERVFDGFRGGKAKAFFYGHTFCGNPLGARLARETLAIFRDEHILDEVSRKGRLLARGMARLDGVVGAERTRALGMIGAVDLALPVEDARGYLSDVGWRVYEEALLRGAYLRPLGNTVYTCPPLTISDADLSGLVDILVDSVLCVLAKGGVT